MWITKATIEAGWRRRAEGQRLLLRDAECRGLALVINWTSMAWRFDYRPRGIDAHTGRRWPMRSITVGNPATHNPDEARAAANKLKGRAASGGDPAAEKRAAAEAERKRRALTLGRLLEEYGKMLPTRPYGERASPLRGMPGRRQRAPGPRLKLWAPTVRQWRT